MFTDKAAGISLPEVHGTPQIQVKQVGKNRSMLGRGRVGMQH